MLLTYDCNSDNFDLIYFPKTINLSKKSLEHRLNNLAEINKEKVLKFYSDEIKNNFKMKFIINNNQNIEQKCFSDKFGTLDLYNVGNWRSKTCFCFKNYKKNNDLNIMDYIKKNECNDAFIDNKLYFFFGFKGELYEIQFLMEEVNKRINNNENNENSNENNNFNNENNKNSNENNKNSNENNKKFLCGGILDLNINFNNVISTKIDNKKYNVIFDENIQILTVNETNEIFYLLPTKNEKISLILYEKKENKKSKLNEFFNTKNNNNNNEITLFEYFNEIYNKINNNNIQTKKRIFLPIFNEKKYLNFNVPKLLENYTIDASDQNTYNIENYEQGSNFENEFDNKSEKNYIEFNIEKDDLIIKNDFIIAVINYDALNEFEIPSLITFLVNI
jgi:hypothetical protein